MSKQELETQARTLRLQRDGLEEQVRALNTQIADLERQISHAEYPCVCVKLNKELDVYNMVEQAAKHRRPLDTGVVSQTLSADENCPIRHGTGKPSVKFS